MGQGLVVSTFGGGMIMPDGTVDGRSLQVLLNDLRNGVITVWQSGNTAARPVNPILSQLYYDTQTVEYLYCSAVRNGAIAAQWVPFGTGGGGSGTVTSITATTPIVVTPDPITSTGTVSHAASGVTPATYGDASHIPQVAVDSKGHVTSVSNIAVSIGAGSVTSVDQAVPVEFTISGNPITTTGTLTIGKANETAHTVWAGPTSGSPAQPTFRLLADGDIPLITGGVVWVTAVGGGGGGGSSTTAASCGAGGGSGETIQSLQFRFTPGSTVSYAIGAAGAADTVGGDTTLGVLTAKGGASGTGISSAASGAGGGAGGAAGAAAGNPGARGTLGFPESACYFGGSSGGGRGNGTTSAGGQGGGAAGNPFGGTGGANVSSQAGGGGGASSMYGVGGNAGAGGSAGTAAAGTAYGAGGGGAGGKVGGLAGGAGAGGYLLIAWLGGAVEFTSGSGTWTVPAA